MPTTGELISLFGGAGGGTAVVFCILWLTGQIHTKSAMDDKNKQIEKLERALEVERLRGDIQVQTAHVVREVMQGLRKEIST